MGISIVTPVVYQLPTPWPATVGVSPNFKAMVCGNTLDELTTAGFLNHIDLQSNPVATTDILQILYDFNPQTQVGNYGAFQVSITNGIITLIPTVSSGDVILPVTRNHIALFANTSGAIYDQGYLFNTIGNKTVPTLNTDNAFVPDNLVAFTDNVGSIGSLPDGGNYGLNGFLIIGAPNAGINGGIVMYPPMPLNGFFGFRPLPNSGNFSSTITNDSTLGQNSTYLLPDVVSDTPIIGCFPDTVTSGLLLAAGAQKGSIVSSSFSTSDLVLNDEINNMISGSAIYFDKHTGTEVAGALTINSQAGVITTSNLTTTSGNEYTFLFTNSFIHPNSGLLLTNGGGSSAGIMLVAYENLVNGQAEIRVINAGSLAFDGNWVISFLVI